MPTNAAQIEALDSELADARERVHRLARGLSEEQWQRRPAPERWSAGEHVVHLTLTTRAFLPLLEEALRNAPAANGPYRRDFVGWMLGRLTEPPVRMRVKTTAPFVPSAAGPMETALRDFDASQDALSALLARGAGRALDRVKVASPFAGRVRYSAWSLLRILPSHQRRHLWLAERDRAGPTV